MTLLGDDELARIKALAGKGDFDPRVLDATYELGLGSGALERAVDDLCEAAVKAVDEGHDILIVSDRRVDARRCRWGRLPGRDRDPRWSGWSP